MFSSSEKLVKRGASHELARSQRGIRRVVAPTEANPYDAWTLDPNLPLSADEVEIEVESINLDATSANQLLAQTGRNEIEFLAAIRKIIAEREKMHNPVTNSGSVMSGIIRRTGANRPDAIVGDRVVTLVSNTLVPLFVEKLTGFDIERHQLSAVGRAALPPFAKFAVVPSDIPTSVALSVFDVCGVVPQVERLCRGNRTAVILGASGKAGLFATFTAVNALGTSGLVIAVVPNEKEAEKLVGLPKNVIPIVCDARNAIRLEGMVRAAIKNGYGDVVIDCTACSGVEIAAAAACRYSEVYRRSSWRRNLRGESKRRIWRGFQSHPTFAGTS